MIRKRGGGLKPKDNPLFISIGGVSSVAVRVRVRGRRVFDVVRRTIIFLESGLYEITFIQVTNLHLNLGLNPVFFLGLARDFTVHNILDFNHPAVDA